MAIDNFPAALVPIIQTGMLEHEFHQALRSVLRYRMICDREEFSTGIGETLTKTRAGLLPTATTPAVPSASATPVNGGFTNLDNGMTPGQWSVEQYTIGINQYNFTLDLNIIAAKVAIASRFIQNVVSLGEQAARTMDELARNNLFSAYLSGNTFVRTTLGSAGATIAVDDVRGFMQTFVNGVLTAIGGGNTMSVVVGADVYTLSAFTVDSSNVSLTPGGKSGTLTFSTSVTVLDGTAGNAVVSAVAPAIIRPNARAASTALQATDTLSMANLLDAKAKLELNAVPKSSGFFNCYLDPVSSRQLFADPDFKILFQGATSESAEFRAGNLTSPFLGLRFLPTTEAFVQPHPTIAGAFIRRPIIVGQGALIEGDFAGIEEVAMQASGGDGIANIADGVVMVTRPPIDRLAQNIAQSWYWIGGFCAPSDTTTNANTVPTATNAAFKRAVVIEHVG
jgi:hypothetical protein